MSENTNHLIHCPLCRAEEKARFIGYKLNNPQGLFPKRNYEGAGKVYRCKNCGLIYNNPPLMLGDAVFEKDDSLLEHTFQNADLIRSAPAYIDILDFLKNEAGLLPGAKALDLGSGAGRVAFALRRAGYETYAVEPKKELFEFCVKNDLSDKDKTFNTSFEQTDFAENSFDFIYLEALNHLHDPNAALQKTLKWLKPGGYLHLEVVNSRWLYKNLLGCFYKFTFRKHSPYTSAQRKPFNACEYSPKSFKVYCRLNKLELIRLSSYPCNTFIPNKLLNKWMSYYMERFNRGMELSVLIKKNQ